MIKSILSIATLLLLTIGTFAQGTDKDTSNINHRNQIYDLMLGTYIDELPKNILNNSTPPGKASRYRLVESHVLELDNDCLCLDTSDFMFLPGEARKFNRMLNSIYGLKDYFLMIKDNNWRIYSQTKENQMRLDAQGTINKNELKTDNDSSSFIIAFDENFIFIAASKRRLEVYACNDKNNSSLPSLSKQYFIDIFKLSAKQFNLNIKIDKCK